MEGHVHSIGESFCNSTQKRTASGKPDTVTHEISVDFRLHSLQYFHDTVLYLSYGLVDAARYVLIGYRCLNRMRCGHIAALHQHRLWCFIIGQINKYRAYLTFDFLGSPESYKDIILTSHVVDDIICNLITCNSDALRFSYTSKRDGSNLSASTSYIDNHITHRSKHIKPHT